MSIGKGSVLDGFSCSCVLHAARLDACSCARTRDCPAFRLHAVHRRIEHDWCGAIGRHLDGTYESATLGLNPYSWVTGAATVANFVTEGLGNLIAAPAGPSNVGRASQMFGGGRFTSSGNAGFAYLRYSFSSSLFIASGSSSFRALRDQPNTSWVKTPSDLSPATSMATLVQDVAVTYQGNQTTPEEVAVFLNKGDGTLSPEVVYTAGMQPAGLATFDVNHDNILDLVVTDNSSSSVYVLLGNANGTFNAAVPYPIAGIAGQSVTIADFDGDGNPDIAATTGFGMGRVSILLGNGNGTFRSGPTFLC